jgi:hypothetical protein
MVVLETVSRDANDFDIALREVLCATSNLTEFSGADWGEVARVREEHSLRMISAKTRCVREDAPKSCPPNRGT